jgi:hypothetical protein
MYWCSNHAAECVQSPAEGDANFTCERWQHREEWYRNSLWMSPEKSKYGLWEYQQLCKIHTHRG